jgi:predicted outer membrane repeat protein
VTLRRVRISNSSGTHGTALNIAQGADVVLEGCVITGNNGGGSGSAIWADVGSQLRLGKETYVTSNNGTGVYFLGERLTVQGASVTGNAAAEFGGGIYAEAAAGGLSRTLVVINSSIVAGNKAGSAGGGIALGRGARLNLFDSDLYRNAAPVGGAVGGLSGSCLVTATRVNFTGE